MTLPVYILSGGQCSRFGSDKARAVIGGQPLIRRIADALGEGLGPITVVAERQDKYADIALRTIADQLPGLGPLGGLYTALCDVNGWILLLSCDLADLRRPWIDRLLASRTPQAQAVAFHHRHWEPLIALYHTSLRAEVRRRLLGGQLGLQSLLDSVTSAAVPLPADWPALLQVNTPAELEQARRHRHV